MEFSYLTRRKFLGTLATAVGATAFPESVVLSPAAAATVGGAAPRPWPGAHAWQSLRQAVGGRLVKPKAPWAAIGAGAVPADLENPWYLEEQAGATQSTGMHGAWTSAPSTYAVAAQSVRDIVAAVNFAREHGVRPVVKGTGHDYFGRSCAPDSLLIWTHRMRGVTVHDGFRPRGAPAAAEALPALSVRAGNRWLEAYAAATAAGRYVQGGGCASVGACGGFALGGGFGSYSKRFGSGAGGVLEIEVITADGAIHVVNRYREPDLFWALRGGGGGTFGVVSRMTLLSHPIPRLDGVLSGSLSAKTDEGYRELIERYLAFVPDALNNPAWGEGVLLVKGKNTIELNTQYLDMSVDDARRVWAPLLEPLRARPDEFTVDARFTVRPFADKWNYSKRTGIVMDDRPGTKPGYFWFEGNVSEVGAYWGAYQGRGIPLSAMRSDAVKALADAFFNASRTSLLNFQTNKALAGEHPEAAARDRETSIHPAVFDNAAFVTLADWTQYQYAGVAGHEPDPETGRKQLADVTAAMAHIKRATPGGASYSNEGDYFEKNWQQEFWGTHYPRLLELKRKYDPGNLFHVHHGVGSENA